LENKIVINKTEIIKYGIELFIVMIGVFLGMLASEWNTNRSQELLLQTSLSNISLELETNENYLKNSLRYHEKINEILDSIWKIIDKAKLYKNFMEVHGFSQIPNWKGIGMRTMQNSSYESAIIGKAFVNMNPTILEKISKIYSDFSTYNSTKEKITDKIININSETKLIDVLLTIEIMRSDIMNYEKYLKDECEKTLVLINKYKK
jgi:hypothetical protein